MKKLLSKILFVGTAGLALAACGATTTDLKFGQCLYSNKHRCSRKRLKDDRRKQTIAHRGGRYLPSVQLS